MGQDYKKLFEEKNEEWLKTCEEVGQKDSEIDALQMQLKEAKKAMIVDFNSKVMKAHVASNLGLKHTALKHVLLPPVGSRFVLMGLVYKFTYVRDNPMRASIEPVGMVQDDKDGSNG